MPQGEGGECTSNCTGGVPGPLLRTDCVCKRGALKSGHFNPEKSGAAYVDQNNQTDHLRRVSSSQPSPRPHACGPNGVSSRTRIWRPTPDLFCMPNLVESRYLTLTDSSGRASFSRGGHVGRPRAKHRNIGDNALRARWCRSAGWQAQGTQNQKHRGPKRWHRCPVARSWMSPLDRPCDLLRLGFVWCADMVCQFLKESKCATRHALPPRIHTNRSMPRMQYTDA